MATGGSPVEVLKPSAEKTNYIRLARLLMSGGTTIVREVFNSIIPPVKLPINLKDPAVLARLRKMKKDKILFASQWKVLFPSSSTYGKSESFDITLLFKLLREFCGLAAPPKGWDDMPDDIDHSLSADLARIKFYRNELCHVKDLGISDGDFNTCGKRIKDTFLRIVSMLPSLGPSKEWEKKIDTLLTGPVTEDEERYIDELESWYLEDLEIKKMLSRIDKKLDSMMPPTKTEESICGEKLVKFLKEYYSKGECSLVLPFPWMEGDRFHVNNLYTSLTMNEKGCIYNIDVANLFSPTKGDKQTAVRNILIEGEAGIGKSTYCKKIAYDWSMGKLEIPDVDLVLVIKCCDLEDGDLWQAIKEQNIPEVLHRTKKGDEEMFDYIDQHRTLIIVDGFDEISATTDAMRKKIKKLVAGQLLPTARVILTSRPERCSDIRKLFDKKLEMKGFSWKDSCNFIKHFCSSSHNADETILSLEKTAAIKELFRRPLNAAFLCLILEDKNIDGDFLKSLDIGFLYREMVFCVIKRYCVEKKGKDVQDDTLMDEYHGKMVVLGEIAFNLIKDNLGTFGEEKMPEDSKQVLKDLGFLIESKILNEIRPKSTYKFSHSSIKEYFAALYVAECLRKGNIDILTSIHKFTENPSTSDIGNSNHVQNVYYSLQRFNVAGMAKISRSEDYVKLIIGLAAHLPNDIDVSQAEFVRFDFVFSFICDLLGTCQEDQANEVIKEITIPDLPVVFYLYNGKQALDGFVSLLSQSTEGTSKAEIKTLRLEGLQAVLSSISVEDCIKFAKALGKHRFLKTVCMSFFSDPADFAFFFEQFRSTSVENLRLQYIFQKIIKCSNIYTILRNLCNLSSLDLSNSSIPNDRRFWVPERQSSIAHNALRVLKICHCDLTLLYDDFIFSALSKITFLKELDLSGSDFSDGTFSGLKGCALRVLRMSHCNIKILDLSCSDFRDGISLDLEGCALRVLRMSDCNLTSRDAEFIFHSLCKSTLKELDMSGNDFRDGITLDPEGNTIQVLKMSHCNLKSRDAEFICHSLRESTTLEELDLSGNDFRDGISFGIEGYSLRVLRMRNCKLRSRDAEYISHSLSSSLKELDLSGNDFRDGISFGLKGCELRVLRMSNCNIKILDLSGNDFSDGISFGIECDLLQLIRMIDCNLRSRDDEYISHSLSSSPEELDLSGNDFREGISLDLEGNTIQVLKMSNCNLTPRDVNNIFDSLRVPITTLEELDMSGNDFSDGITFGLVGFSLRVLRMSNCNLKASDAESISHSLSGSSLEELDLSGNDFSDGITFGLVGYSLRVLKMSNCNLKSSDAESISHSLSSSLEELDLSGNALDETFKASLKNQLPKVEIQF